ncbi:MAG: aminotransferase class I/II-fold pyridoxal phosphate-dependent enzyme [Devosia sp.]
MATQPYRMGSPIGARMRINDRDMDYFCGTSYYALHGNPIVIEAARAAVAAYGLGPGTLAQVPVYDEVIDRSRTFFETEAASYVVSGYVSPLVLLQALEDRYDVIYVDAASHYSIGDAIKTIDKPVIRFRHLDAGHLAEQLRATLQPGQVPAIVSDGIFPSSGALAPLAEYAAVIASYDGALICVDDSHAVGVVGEKGQGSLEYAGVAGPNRYLAGTLSKAFGGSGGIVPGSAELAERVKKNVRLVAGASPTPVPAAAAAAAGLKLLTENPEMRQTLWRNVRHVRQGLRDLGLSIPDTPVPIVSLRAPTDLERVRAALEARDIATKRTPAGGYSDAPDVETLRIAVFSTHTPEQLDRLLSALGELL